MNLAHNLKLKRHSIEHFHAPYGTSDWRRRRDLNYKVPGKSNIMRINHVASNLLVSGFVCNLA